MKKINLLILLFLNIIINSELLFIEQDFSDFGISLGFGNMITCSDCDENQRDRDFYFDNYLNLSFLVKGQSKINFLKLLNYQNINTSNYDLLSIEHYFKDNSFFDMKFNVYFDFIKSHQNDYERFSYGLGLSKALDSKDLASSFTVSAIFYSYSSAELLSLNGNGWYLDLAFPIYLRVLPSDNIPSKFSYLFTPRLIFDTQDISLSQKKALYFDCKFNIFVFI